MSERRKSFESANTELRIADKVIIVGGGTVGVELAAGIAAKWGRRKKVTLVASQER